MTQDRHKRAEGVSPVTDGVFLLRSQLRGGECVAAWGEDRVVSEAVAAPRLGYQASFEHAFDHPLVTVGCSHGCRAMKGRSSPLARNVGELGKEQLQVRRIVPV